MSDHNNKPGVEFDELTPIINNETNSTSVPRNFPCHLCDKVFTRADNRSRHIRVDHEGKRTTQCADCGKSFKHQKNLIAHTCRPKIPADKPKTLWKCDECPLTFKHESRLKTHKMTHRRQHTCKLCHEPISSMRTHIIHCKSLRCKKCGKQSISKYAFDHHTCHKDNIDDKTCSICHKKFSRRIDKTQHEAVCGKNVCRICKAEFKTLEELQKHRPIHQKQKKVPGLPTSKKQRQRTRGYTCRFNQCGTHFSTRAELLRHRLDVHIEPNPEDRWTQPFPWLKKDGTVDEQLYQILNQNTTHIFRSHEHDETDSVYNFSLVNEDEWVFGLKSALDKVEANATGSSLLNIYLGYLLENEDDKELRYFTAGSNFAIFDSPLRIERPSDWKNVLTNFTEESFIKNFKSIRPSTKWQLKMVTNAHIHVYDLDIPMGHGPVPTEILSSQSIRSLVKDSKGVAYNDNNCAVRALAFHQLSKNNPRISSPPGSVTDIKLNKRTEELAAQWKSDGLLLSDVPEFEVCFDIDVDIFTLFSDGSVSPVYLSNGTRGDNKITLNLSDNHLSYITNVPAYLKKYLCSGCACVYRQLSDYLRHRVICTQSTILDYSWDHYSSSQTIFNRLECNRIIVDEKERVYPWVATFDCEALLKLMDPMPGGTRKTRRHHLVALSSCSNIPEYTEPECIVSTDPAEIVSKAVEQLKRIQAKASKLARIKWAKVIEEIDTRIEKLKLESNQTDTKQNDQTYDTSSQSDDEDAPNQDDCELKRLGRLKCMFLDYCDTLPILGMNSANYDTNLLKPYLLPALGFGGCLKTKDGTALPQLEHDKQSYVIKKNNSYTCISANKLRFLDISQYLAPGTSYSKLLKAYDVEEQKGFLPYEWMTDETCLDHPRLPNYDSFKSSLKKMNVLEACDNGTQDHELGLKRYEELEKLWKEKQWTRFADYLSYYTNLDTKPFVTAIERMQKFYFSHNIDVFKSAISIPGVARQMLFDIAKDQNISFASVLERDEDFFHNLKRNIVGGPSIVYHRDHAVDRTFIRNNPDFLCKSLVGYDAAALYLWALNQFMPCGSYIRRFAENGFRADRRIAMSAHYDWLDYMAASTGKTIWHGRNHGEVFIGKYPVDGYCPETGEAFEYDGCYYHGCNLCGKKDTEIRVKLREKTETRRQYIESVGVPVIYIKECQYEKQLKQARDETRVDGKLNMYDFSKERLPNFYRRNMFKKNFTEADMLKAVEKGELYGMIEVDINVPKDKWSYFSEMSPLFHTIDVPMEDIGPSMQEYVKEVNRKCKKKDKVNSGISTRPRHLLVGGMSAEKTLLHTDLVQWYLKHGLEVTKVYQVIEYKNRRCFQPFVEKVSTARRDGDADPSKKPLAEACKLIGNSGFGSLILDRTRHRDVSYVSDIGIVRQKMNNARFRALTHVTSELMEVISAKQKIKVDLPIQLGYTILQLAKLRILQFYYDFLIKFCDPSSFQLCQMDTDSLYMALSGPNLASIVKEDKRAEFNAQIQNCTDKPHTPDQGYFLPRECCEAHKKYDSRTPGLFKIEATGTEMISLCSKTYSLMTTDGSCKFSSKGLNKRALTDPHSIYKEVLTTGIPKSGTNVGIRTFNHEVFTYEQDRKAIGYFYCKRQVQPDGVSTEPLKTVLKPWAERNLEIVNKDHPLWPGRVLHLIIDGKRYETLMDVCVAAGKITNAESLVMEALKLARKDIVGKFPKYKPSGELVFVAEGVFARSGYRKNHCYYWTTGMSERAVGLVSADKYPGRNNLAKLWTQIYTKN